MGLGTGLHHLLNHPRFPVLETIGFLIPGEVFPAFFEMEMLQPVSYTHLTLPTISDV